MSRPWLLLFCSLSLAVLVPARFARAETGYDAWLRYPAIADGAVRARYDALPAAGVVVGDSPVLLAARDELIRGVRGLLGRTLRVDASPPKEPAILLGTARSLAA